MSAHPKLLYVDDSNLDHDLVRDALCEDESAFDLTEAYSREEFEEKLRSAKYDLILSDFHIHGYTGFQVLDAVKKVDVDLPVVFVTGTGSEEIAVEAMRRGAADYVIKTADHIRRLPLTIRAVLARHAATMDGRKAEDRLKAVSRARHLMGQCSRALVRASSERQLLDEMCSIAAKLGEFKLVFIALNRGENLLQLAASAGVNDNPDAWEPILKDYLRSAVGPAACAIRKGEFQTLQDLDSEGPNESWRAAALAMGSRSITALPLIHGGAILGVLNVFADQADAMPTNEMALFKDLADDIAFGVATLRARAQHKLTEQALYESEQFARATLDALPQQIWVVDPLGTVIAVSDAREGFAAGEVCGVRDVHVGADFFALCGRADLRSADDARLLAQGTRDVIEGRKTSFRLEYGPRTAAQQRWYVTKVTPFPGECPRRVVVAHEDVTEKEIGKAALVESESRYRLLSELAADYFWEFDEQYRFTGLWSGPRAAPPPDSTAWIGHTPWEVEPHFNVDNTTWAEHRQMLDARQPFRDLVLSRIGPAGRHIRISVSGHPIFDVEGAFRGYRGITRDVTAIKRDEFLSALEHKVTRLLAQEDVVLVAITAAMQAICAAESWDCCRFFVPKANTLELECVAAWSTENPVIEQFVAASRVQLYSKDAGLLGRAWQSGTAVWSENVQSDDRAVLMSHAQAAGVRGAFVLPLLAAERVVGLLAFSSSQLREPDLRLKETFASLGSQIGQHLQRQKAESDLRRFRLAIDLTTDCVVLVDRQSMRYVDANEGACQMLGYTRAELLEMGPQDVVVGSRSELETEYDAVIAQGSGVRSAAYRRRDGTTVPVEIVRGAAQVDGKWMIASSARDVAARIAADDEIRASNERFLQVFNQQFQYMAIISATGVLIEANDVLVALSGAPREASIGRYFWECPWLRDLPSAPDHWARSLEQATLHGQTVWEQTRFLAPGGALREVELSLSLLHGARGTGGYCLVQAIDVTERIQAAASARDREELLHIASQTARLGGWIIDLPVTRVVWSDEVCAIHEMPAGTMLTLDEALEFYPPEYRETIATAVARCMEEGTPFDLELEIVTAHKRRVWVRATGRADHGNSGAIVRIRGALQDISPMKRAEENVRATAAAQQANSAKSEFLAMMSHEIRTPMNGVIGMIDVLYQTRLEFDQIEMLDLIRDSASSLLRIVNDILDFSKIEAEKMAIDLSPMSPATVVEAVCEMEDHVARKTGIVLQVFTDPGIPEMVLGDAVRLRQILVNLVNNAIKFSDQVAHTGEVSVRARVVRRENEIVTVEFRVTDQGIGMSEETLSRLFTSFSQADVSTTRRFGGTGLGLAISSRLCRLMGGEISVQSAPGFGSSFTVILPFATLPKAQGAQHSKSLVSGLHCIIVGENNERSEDLATYLRFAGAAVERVDPENLAAHSTLGYVPDSVVWVFIERKEPLAGDLLDIIRGAYAERRPAVVILGRRMRTKVTARTEGAVRIDSHLLTRQTFLAAVALAAGRVEAVESGSMWASTTPIEPRLKPVSKFAAGRSILVAEDNLNNQRVILRQLDLLGCRVEMANSGKQALDVWRGGKFELVLTDLQMPEMDGYELTRSIRRLEGETARVPIVALTATAQAGEKERCLEAGMDDYLTKPTRLVALQETLEKWLFNNQPEEGVERAGEETAPQLTYEPLQERILADVVGDDPVVLRQFIEDFRVAASSAAIALIAAIRSGNVHSASAVAHQLKSSARTVGAMALGNYCEEIETAGRCSDVEKLRQLCPDFELEIGRVLKFIDDRGGHR